MKNRITLPRCDDLHADPQLAVLAVLEAATDVTVPVLGAMYPEIGTLELSDDRVPELDAAVRVIELARALATTIRLYKRALRDSKRRDELLPF